MDASSSQYQQELKNYAISASVKFYSTWIDHFFSEHGNGEINWFLKWNFAFAFNENSRPTFIFTRLKFGHATTIIMFCTHRHCIFFLFKSYIKSFSKFSLSFKQLTGCVRWKVDNQKSSQWLFSNIRNRPMKYTYSDQRHNTEKTVFSV